MSLRTGQGHQSHQGADVLTGPPVLAPYPAREIAAVHARDPAELLAFLARQGVTFRVERPLAGAGPEASTEPRLIAHDPERVLRDSPIAEAARAQITTYKRHLMALVDPVAAGVSSRPDAWPCCICLRFAFEAAGMRCYWCRRRADDPTLTATLEEARARAATVAASGAGSTGLDWEAARAEAAAARAAARDPDRRGRRSTRHRSADAVSSPHAVHASDRHSHPTPYTAAERPEATSEDAHA